MEWVVCKEISSAPSFQVSLRGFASEQEASRLGNLLGAFVLEFGRYFDLSQLDGVTVARDYRQALLDLDRGTDGCSPLSPSDNGVAMAARVRRSGILKSHVVFDAAYVEALQDQENSEYLSSLHGLAHECAHVEITHRFDTAFPGILLTRRFSHDPRDQYRQGIWLSCWEEYAATRLSAQFGTSPSEGYTAYFVDSLLSSRRAANEAIADYRLHADLARVLCQVYDVYGRLMKLASYFMGDFFARSLSDDEMPSAVVEALQGHWFAPYYDRLSNALTAVADGYGSWGSIDTFSPIAGIADELVVQGGVITEERSDGSFYIHIPFSAETEPGYYG